MSRFTAGPVRIAYDTVGSGDQNLVVIPGWISHLEYDWTTPEIRSFYQRLASSRRVIRYDKRGLGLSDRPTGPKTYALETQVEDLGAVLDAAGVTRAVLFGWSMGGPVALAYAARYPERVSRLVLYGTFARVLPTPGYPIGLDITILPALLDLVRAEWGLGTRALTDFVIPEADAERLAWFTTYQRVAMSPQAAADFLLAVGQIDTRALLRSIEIPALVLHRRRDCLLPYELGQYLAQHLPQATFRELSGEHHTPYFGDSEAVTQAIEGFLHLPMTPETWIKPLTPRELEILRLVAEGCQNTDIADRLCISPATVRRHLANLYTKLGVSTRAAAVAYAFRHELV